MLDEDEFKALVFSLDGTKTEDEVEELLARADPDNNKLLTYSDVGSLSASHAVSWRMRGRRGVYAMTSPCPLQPTSYPPQCVTHLSEELVRLMDLGISGMQSGPHVAKGNRSPQSAASPSGAGVP